MSGGIKSKSVSIFLTLFVIITLVMLGPASAISLNLSAPNDAAQGQDVEFSINMELETPDQYLPIAYTELVFTGPDGFEETCKVFNDGSYMDCALDLTIEVVFNTGYGQGYGIGYGYGYNYGYNYQFFGYGYGYGYGSYGEEPEATYNIIWHTTNEIDAGDYNVQARMHVIQDDYYDELPFSYCDVMLGMYREWYHFAGNGSSYYDPYIDLHYDGVIDLSDIAVFAAEHSDDAEMYGRFVEYLRLVSSNGTINPQLDVFPEGGDGVIDLSDVAFFSQHYYAENSEAWCAIQIDRYHEGNYEIYETNSESFEITVPEEQQNNGNGGRDPARRGGYNNINQTINDTTPTDQGNNQELNQQEGNGEDLLNNEASTTTDAQGGGNIFSAITGAIAGVGNSLGLGATVSYLIALLILVLVILGIFRRVNKKKN